MYHYTYLIKHGKMKYIGVRSCKCAPIDDINYWGSSKHLPPNIKDVGKKRILKVHKTRKAAVAHEIWLHNKYDVAVNPLFYNKAKQTSTKFDTTGVPVPKGRRESISATLKGKEFSYEYRQKISASLKGRTFTEEHKEKISNRMKKEFRENPIWLQRLLNGHSTDSNKKLSAAQKERWKRIPAFKMAPRFSPWYIMYVGKNYSEVYYDKTKKEIAEEKGIAVSALKDAIYRSRGTKIVGLLGDRVIANNIAKI